MEGPDLNCFQHTETRGNDERRPRFDSMLREADDKPELLRGPANTAAAVLMVLLKFDFPRTRK